jgi:hypothetical protein
VYGRQRAGVVASRAGGPRPFAQTSALATGACEAFASFVEQGEATIAAEKIVAKDPTKLAEVVAREDKAAQPWACKLLIVQIPPPARGPFCMVEIAGLQDMPAAYAIALTAASVGEVTLSETKKIGGLLVGFAKAFEDASGRNHLNGSRPTSD